MKRWTLLGIAVAFLVGCQDRQLPTGTDLLPPQAAISDATHDAGNDEFFFLPPLVPDPCCSDPFNVGGFNPDLAPVVEICELDEIDPDTCSDPQPAGFPVVFTVDGGPGEDDDDDDEGARIRVNRSRERYQVNWDTDDFNLSSRKFYRISVFASDKLLGFADLDVLGDDDDDDDDDGDDDDDDDDGFRNLNTGEFVPLEDDDDLRIRFRIEEFALCPDTRNCVSKVVGENDTEYSLDDGKILLDIPGGQGFSGTLTLKPCTGGDGAVDGLIDLPTFGPCLESETDFTGQTLEFPATLSLCDLSDFPEIAALSMDQQDQLTLYHFGNDGSIDALPEANKCPTNGSLPSNPLFRFARAIGDRFLSFAAPRPLEAAMMRRINRGGGGDLDELESLFKLVLPGKIEFVDVAVRTDVEVGTFVMAQVRVTDLVGGDLGGVAGATVRYNLGSSPMPNEEFAGASLPEDGENEVVTNGDGFADIRWTISTNIGINELTAGGKGIASPDFNGPRATFDPFIPIQVDPESEVPPVPPEEELVVVRDAAGLPVTEITFTVDGVPGPPDEILFTTPPVTSEAGATIPVAVTLEDRFDNVATNATSPEHDITLAIGNNPDGGTLFPVGALTVAPDNGVGTFLGVNIQKADDGYTLVASISNPSPGVTATSDAFNIFHAAPATLEFTVPPTDTDAGAIMSPVEVTLTDAFGNLATNATAADAVTLVIGASPDGGSLSGGSAVDPVLGVSTFSSLSIDQAGGGYTLVARTAALVDAAESAEFDILAVVAGILIYGPSMSAPDPFGSLARPENEQTIAEVAGLNVTVATEAQWSNFTAAQFASFQAIVFGDPTCSNDPSLLATATSNKSVWSPAIEGPVIVIGSDPQWHQWQTTSRTAPTLPIGTAALKLIENGIAFAASGNKTGLYVSLSCYFFNVTSATTLSFLNGIGTFVVEGQSAVGDQVTITATGGSHPALTGLTSADLSGWGNTVHEIFPISFTSFPTGFVVLVTAPRSSEDLPFIIARPGS